MKSHESFFSSNILSQDNGNYFNNQKEQIPSKQALRNLLKERINAFSEDHTAVQNACIQAAKLLASSEIFTNSDTILIYASTENEINTMLIIDLAVKKNKRIAIPRTNKTDCTMFFHYLDGRVPFKEQVQKGAFGILEPLSELPVVNISNIHKNLIIIVPGIAFTKSGIRLGHGKGYYDRFIGNLPTSQGTDCIAPSTRITTIGFCYDFQIVSNIPSEAHDVSMNYILTPSHFCPCVQRDI